MKNKLLLLILCLSVSLMLCSCSMSIVFSFGDTMSSLLGSNERYACNADEVVSIEIVRIGDYIEEEYRYEYEVLSTVADHSWFIDDLNDIEQKKNVLGAPFVLDNGHVVIRVGYSNGDYDFVHHGGQILYRGGSYYTGYYIFDYDEFVQLIYVNLETVDYQ
ncbi:MAG: hypothetical protein IKC32_02865 [Clostridia bacterium]|nr:hypothetical protein [Clostridia bacterium]